MRKDKIKGFFSGIIVSTLVMGVSLTAFAAAGQLGQQDKIHLYRYSAFTSGFCHYTGYPC